MGDPVGLAYPSGDCRFRIGYGFQNRA